MVNNTFGAQLCQVGEEPGVLNSNSQQRGRMTTKDCPECGHIVRRSNAKMECMALPAGVRFDPSDEELLVHLAAKMGRSNMMSHPLIDDFISFLDGEDGICGTHPEKLPGVKKDGSSCHFFHRPSMAYTTGTRKRRKIHANGREEVRWHKTGKTRPVLQNRKVLGFKKIMVLYERVGKKSKNVKTNWVMHQYHLGENEEETDGELVVCKVFFQKQPRNCSGGAPKTSDMLAEEECELSESDIVSNWNQAGRSDFTSSIVSGVTKDSYNSIRANQNKRKEHQLESISAISEEGSHGLHTHSTLSKKQDCSRNRAHNLVSSSDHQNGGIHQACGAGSGCEEEHTVNLGDEEQPWEAVVNTHGGGDLNETSLHFEPEILELLCNEKLNGDPLVEDSSYGDMNLPGDAQHVGSSLELLEEFGAGAVQKMEDELELGSPPNVLEYPVVTSQEIRDWLGKNSSQVELDNTDSQSAC
ncbi:unnamed protein product [Sphagnum troendelagicum]|uniref:NAC domain-containing protein n=1 Tax=Sphagnum troendelagicum TaxID=128251 RepID=A0ABP0TUC5_9BRYO